MFLGFELHALVVLTRSGSKLTILGRFVNIFFWNPSLSFWCRLRRGLMGGLATMELIMLQGARILTLEATNEFRRAYTVYRCAFNALADLAASKKRATYHVRPKLHQLSHLVWNHVPRNPRYYACYLDEDMISRTKRVAERSHPLFMSRLTMFRYTLHACMRFGDVKFWTAAGLEKRTWVKFWMNQDLSSM